MLGAPESAVCMNDKKSQLIVWNTMEPSSCALSVKDSELIS